jgi:hypothetical protein
MGYNHYLHRKIRDRVKKCLCCGSKINLEVHHIDGDISNNDYDNLSVLCSKCHQGKAHLFNRDIRGRFINKYINIDFLAYNINEVSLNGQITI